MDPMAELMTSWSPYNYTFNNPILLTDPTGMAPSTHTDEDGNVIKVYKDGDLSVYKHKGDGKAARKSLEANYSKENTSGGGEKMGETDYIDEFINPETGEDMTGTQIQFGEKWDPVLDENFTKAKGMEPISVASESFGGGIFDIKGKAQYKNQGRLLNGKYATTRSAGNYLAGMNAAELGLSFNSFQKLAGALHLNGNLSKGEMVNILLTGKAYGSAPTYGENSYQYRMSKAGFGEGFKKASSFIKYKGY